MTETSTKIDEARQRLESAVAELTTSEGWKQYLDTQSKFHRYSFGNVMLIGFQCPDATQVAGYRAWQALERQVRKGEKGIAILAPIIYRKKNDAGETVTQHDDSGRSCVGFRTVHVFDIAQTDGPDLPELPCHRLDSDSGLTDLSDTLIAHVMSEGLELARESIPGETNGYIARAERRIVIDSDLSRDQSLKPLIHELAHWHDLDPGQDLAEHYDRADAELVAESVAYVVASSVGLDTSDYSVGYLESK